MWFFLLISKRSGSRLLILQCFSSVSSQLFSVGINIQYDFTLKETKEKGGKERIGLGCLFGLKIIKICCWICAAFFVRCWRISSELMAAGQSEASFHPKALSYPKEQSVNEVMTFRERNAKQHFNEPSAKTQL